MANQSIVIPVGKASHVTVQAFDSASSDITAAGIVSIQSSDPTIVQVSQMSPNTFSVAAAKTGTAQVTYTYTNSGGTVSETDTINPPDPPDSLQVSYGTPA